MRLFGRELSLTNTIRDLKAGKISSWQQFEALGNVVGFGGVWLVLFFLNLKRVEFDYSTFNMTAITLEQWSTYALVVLAFLMVSFGFLNCYWINRARDDQDFVLRYIVLAGGILQRLALMSILALMIELGYQLAFGTIGRFKGSWYERLLLVPPYLGVIFGLVTVIAFFGWLSYAFTQVAGTKRT